MASASSQFAIAISQHQAGRLAQAETGYREILARDPNHAEALHLLALIASEVGQHETAVLLLGRAIEIKGPVPLFYSNLGLVLSRQGKPEHAVLCYRRALERNPRDPKMHARLGRTLLELGRPSEARKALETSLKLEPRSPETHHNLGNAQRVLHCLDAAEESYRRAISLDPDSAESNFELGNILHATGRHEEAAACYLEAVRAQPTYAEAFYNLGVTRTIQHRLEDALAAYQQAVQFRPDYPEAQNNLGILLKIFQNDDAAADRYAKALQCSAGSLEARYNLALLLQDQDRLEEALQAYQALLDEQPGHLEALNNLGNVQLALGHAAEAQASYRGALEVDPQYAEAHWNLALAHLRAGNFEEGWRKYEWRFKQKGQLAREFAAPPWDGSSLKGRRILLHAEQGLGDAIQFVRYAAVLRAEGAEVILECHQPLAGLLSGADGVQQLVARGGALPEFDCHAALLSVPGLTGTTLNSVPCQVPYIQVESLRGERWRNIVDSHTPPKTVLRVGLTWSGNPEHKENARRSVPARVLAELAGTPGVAFYSLQKGAPGVTHAEELAALELIRLEDESTGLLDTAAILLNLDLLISVDTSLAHLAGALARPVWTLLPFYADWRWLEQRDDSPWYPTMRLFRQSRRGDWTDVIERVRNELQLLRR